ncbi:MAG TPA: hypothetical protein VF440_01780 [Novosphingobium sp.]
MAEIEDIFDRIVACSADAEAAAAAKDSGLARRLLQIRVAYNDESAKLLHAVKADPRLKTNAEIASQLDAHISQMRVQMGRMQAKWRMHEIEADPASYLLEIKRINRAIEETRDWVRATLGAIR